MPPRSPGAAIGVPAVPPPRPTLAACGRFEELGLFRQLRHDLERYKDLSREHRAIYLNFCARRKRACLTLRIVRGIAYVLDLYPGYQSRIKSTALAVYRALQRLGPTADTEVVIDVTDGELQNVDLPVLVITHRASRPVGVLYPDFTFYSWPESACPPAEPSHAYGLLFDAFARNWTQRRARWQNRSDTLFWRGARVGDGGLRATALRHLRAARGTDAAFIAWRAVSATGRNQAPGCVGLLEQCRHRYLAFLAGTTYSSRLKYQLSCGSTVLAVPPEFVEWWTHLLKPGVHFAEVAGDWSDAPGVLESLRRRPAEARALAVRGQRLALGALSPAAVDCYWWHLLDASSTVLPQPPARSPLPRHARPLEDVLLWPDGVVLSAEASGPAGGAPSQLVRPPRELQDRACFEGTGLIWEHCCDTESFGPYGDVRCWESADQAAGLRFERCCLSE